MDDDYAVSKNSLVNQTETNHERRLKAALDALVVNWRWVQHLRVCGYYPDLYEPTSRICLEVDGEYHDTPKKRLRDRERDMTLQEHGILTIRFPNKRIETNIEGCIAEVVREYQNRLKSALLSHDEYEPLDVDAIRAQHARALDADPFAPASAAKRG